MTPAPSSLYYVWDPPGATLTVLMNLDLVDGLRVWIDNARNANQDVQGFLVGHRETDSAGRTVITVEDCEPVAAGEIGSVPERSANEQYGPVGFLNSGPHLSAEQINAIRRLFREPDPVLLSVAPEPELSGRWAILDPSVEVEPESAWFPFDRTALARDSAHLLRSPSARVSRFEPGINRWGRRGLLGAVALLLLGGGWAGYRLLPHGGAVPLQEAHAAYTPARAADAVPQLESTVPAATTGEQAGSVTPPQPPRVATADPRPAAKPTRVSEADEADDEKPSGEADRRAVVHHVPAVPSPAVAALPPAKTATSLPPVKTHLTIAQQAASVQFELAPESRIRKALKRVPGLGLLGRLRFKGQKRFTAAKPVRIVKPSAAFDSGPDSTVRLAVYLDEEGRVSGVEALEPRASDRLIGMATTAVYNSRFEPARLDGQPVDSRLIATFDFHPPPVGRN